MKNSKIFLLAIAAMISSICVAGANNNIKLLRCAQVFHKQARNCSQRDLHFGFTGDQGKDITGSEFLAILNCQHNGKKADEVALDIFMDTGCENCLEFIIRTGVVRDFLANNIHKLGNLTLSEIEKHAVFPPFQKKLESQLSQFKK